MKILSSRSLKWQVPEAIRISWCVRIVVIDTGLNTPDDFLTFKGTVSTSYEQKLVAKKPIIVALIAGKAEAPISVERSQPAAKSIRFFGCRFQ
jgi:hypothetical protein